VTFLLIAAGWLLAAVLVAVVVAAIGRGGAEEDRRRGYDRQAHPPTGARPPARGRARPEALALLG
jgi:hypothetical protein